MPDEAAPPASLCSAFVGVAARVAARVADGETDGMPLGLVVEDCDGSVLGVTVGTADVMAGCVLRSSTSLGGARKPTLSSRPAAKGSEGSSSMRCDITTGTSVIASVGLLLSMRVC